MTIVPRPLPRSRQKEPSPNSVEQCLALMPDDADVDETVLGAAFLAAPLASFLLDGTGRILVCNRRAERLFCPSDLEDPVLMRGMNFGALTHLNTSDVQQRLREGAMKGAARFRMKRTRQSNPSGGTIFHMSLLPSASARSVLFLLTQDRLKPTAEALSTTNARRIETRDALAQSRAECFELQTGLVAMESFAHTASHDLRTPLNTLSGLLHLFDSKFAEGLPDKAHEYLSYMSRAVKQMDEMTTDFLEHARSASADISLEDVDMRDLLKDLMHDLRSDFEAVDGSIVLKGAGWPVEADRSLLRMLVTNIFSNSLKYRHPERPPVLTVEMSETDTSKVISFSDNGIGFDPKERTSIFLPFQRVNTEIDGSGIGLSTCKEVCRRHGWEISAKSDGETGAQFDVVIPTSQTPDNG